MDEIDYSEHFEGAPDDIKDMLKAKMEEEFERLKGKTFFVFKPNDSLELIAPNYVGKIISDKGTWKMNAAQDSIFFDIEIPESYKIIELNSEKLILKTDDMPKRTLHLSKTDK